MAQTFKIIEVAVGSSRYEHAIFSEMESSSLHPVPNNSSIWDMRINGTSVFHRSNTSSVSSSETPNASYIQVEFTDIKVSTDSNTLKPPPILFVHGLASNRAMLKGLALSLSCGLNTNVALLDLRGHGQSKSVNADLSTFTMDCMIQDIAKVIREIQAKTSQSSDHWNDPILMVGHSFGANLVLELCAHIEAINHKQSSDAVSLSSMNDLAVCGCVLLDGGFINLKKQYPHYERCRQMLEPPNFRNMTRIELEDSIRQQWCQNWSTEAQSAFLLNFNFVYDNGLQFAYPNLSYLRHMHLLRDLWDHPPSPLCRRTARDRDNITNCEGEEVCPNRSIPTLIVPADDGQPCAFSANKLDDVTALAASLEPNSRIHWMHGHGHDFPAQYPLETANVIASFVKDGFFGKPS